MTQIHPEIVGSLIGVGALGGAWAVKQAFSYLRWKVSGKNGNGLAGLNYGPWMKSSTARSIIVNSNLRQTKDPKQRKALLAEKRAIMKQKRAEYIGHVPKTGKKEYIEESKRRKSLP